MGGGGVGVGVGGGGVGGGVTLLTVTVALVLAVPPAPVQAKEYAEVTVRLPVGLVPEVLLAPLQAPEAVQEVALVLLQDRLLLAPLFIVVGLALKETVGGLVPVDTFRVVLLADSLAELSIADTA